MFSFVVPFATTTSFSTAMAASTLGSAWLVNENDLSAKKKPKRIVKHKKKAWRITSNVEDVERFLESKRLDERLGYVLVYHYLNVQLKHIHCIFTEHLSRSERTRVFLLLTQSLKNTNPKRVNQQENASSRKSDL